MQDEYEHYTTEQIVRQRNAAAKRAGLFRSTLPKGKTIEGINISEPIADPSLLLSALIKKMKHA